MAKSFVQELGERLASVESRLSSLSSGNRLDHASLDGTTLYLRDSDGNLSGRLGRQPDGSNGVHVVKVQPPPQLTAPILTVGEQAGTCLVEWDGRTFDGRRMPLIHGHTEIWAELVGEDWSPTVAPGGSAKRVGTIRDRTGGEVVVALPQAGTWAVWLRAMGADRETAGPWSPVATVEIKPLVDTEAIEAELEDARDRITEADERLTAGQEALTGHLDNLNDVRLPALEQDISNAVSEATADIQDFENRWDAQWDTTIPALADRQDTLEGEITDGLTQVHNQAEALAEAARDDAVNMAAANAQSEYDRLQELAERALSRAGDNVLEDPSFEDNHWRDAWNSLGNRLVRNTTSPVRTGNLALVIEDGSPVDFEFPDIDVELDQSYRMTIWYRTWASNLADLSDGESALVFYDSDTGAELAVSEPLTEGSTYRRAQVVYTVPEGVQSIRPTLRASWPTGQVLFDDVSVREVGAAAEALRLAEVARQQAEAAHIAAGNAVDAAANAYDAASSKSTVHWSLSEPSGTADNSDDVWWRYELRNGRRVVIGQWFWDDGVWRETEIAEEWLPLVNIGTGTYGDMSGDRLEANTVETRHLLVGPGNLNADTDFQSLGRGGTRSWWSVDEGVWYQSSVTWDGITYPIARMSSSDATDSSSYNMWFGGGYLNQNVLPVRPGETVKIRFQVVRYLGGSSSDGYDLNVSWRDGSGSGVGWGGVSSFASVGNRGWFEYEATAPEGARYFGVRFRNQGSAGGPRGVLNVAIEKMVDSSLIVQGAVKAEHVDSVSLTASSAFLDNAMVNLIQGRMANFDEALIGGVLLKEGAVGLNHLTSNTVVIDALLQASTAELQELFFDTAVGNALWVNAVRSRLVESQGIITEDMIATGAITTPKLTVTEEMVAEVVKVMRLEGDEMDFNIIRGMIIEAAQIQGSVFRAEGPDGEETVRLDGMDNFLRGSIHAGVAEGAEIHLDHGPVTVQRADETSTVYDTAYISFDTALSTLTPRIWVNPDTGSLYISAGGNESTPAFRGRVRVGGDLGANRLDGNQLLVRGGNEQTEGFTRTGGMLNSSGQVRVVGQHASSVSSQDMVVMGDGGAAREVSPTGSYRSDIVYGAPSDGGSRRPIVSTHMSNTSHDGGRMVSTTTARRGSAAFETRSRQIYNTASGNASFFIYYHAAWG